MRCFVAVPAPAELRGKLAALDKDLKGFGNMKYVEEENIHMTLKFLGDVEEKKADDIKGKLETITEQDRFDVTLSGVGAFPNTNYIKVLWVGVADGAQEFNTLHELVDDALRPLGFKDEKRFHPHYTIARVKSVKDKGGLKGYLAENESKSFGSYTVDKVELMSSELGPSGPTYTVLEDYSLR